MKLGLASDLHLDFADINQEFYDWRGDILLLAGDLGEDDFLRKHGHEFFDRASLMADCVLVISGNHEYYGSELDTADDHLDRFFEQWKNIIPLRNRAIKIAKLDIFGATMWTDFHRSPIAEISAMQGLNDYRQIRLKRKSYGKINPGDIRLEFSRGYTALGNWLDEDTDGIRVVMTHHAPSMRSVPGRYKHDYEMNKAYCNQFDSLIEAHPEIVAWVHGHTHDYFDYMIGDTRVMCNPRGYPGERPGHLPPYQPLTFEI